MKLCDVNIFIHAHRADQPSHHFYHHWLTETLTQESTFLYSDFVFSSFLRIVTHPKIYKTPSPVDQAFTFIETVRSQPNAVSIKPGARHWSIFKNLCQQSKATGNLIPDAYLAALAIEANAEWVSADADFARFEPELKYHRLRP